MILVCLFKQMLSSEKIWNLLQSVTAKMKLDRKIRYDAANVVTEFFIRNDAENVRLLVTFKITPVFINTASK